MRNHGRDTENGEFDWRRLEAMARRGFGRMRGLGVEGLGDNFRVGRMLASGDLRLVALFLIEQQPRHGYDLIKAIEEKTAGFYSPSPGIVYPALTFLEEAGYVTALPQGNKKAYEITPEGRAHLDENRAGVQSTLDYLANIGRRMGEMRDRMAEAGGRAWRGERQDRDIPDVLPEVNAARQALKSAIIEAIGQGEEAQRRLARLLQQAADAIRASKPDAQQDDIDLG